MKGFFKKCGRVIGPGFITGAADDDPSGIATYSQAGAQFGYGQLWTSIFMLPLQTAIQEACARIGAVTGKGLAAVIKENYNKKIVFVVIFLILIANTINIGANIGAMAAAVQLIVPVNFVFITIFIAVGTLLLEVFITYRCYANYLKWLGLTLLAYPLTVFFVKEPWGTLLRATFVPHLEFNFQFLFIITGVLGTTISPYLFFWQPSQVVEEEKANNMLKKEGNPHITKKFMRTLRIDNFIGMLASQIVTWSIIVVGATALHAHGITDVKTAADAAKALEPLVQTFPNAGFLAKLIFSIGIFGLGLLSVPVLAGSAAYAFSEAFNWQQGLNLKYKTAPGFYGVIAFATLIGLSINFIGIDPIKALIYSAVINGIVAAPLILIIALIGKNKKIMGKYTNGKLSNIFVWLTFIVMSIAAITLLFSFIKK